MSFDSSRFPFNSWNDFNGVVMQQGRVQLDSDWNEWLGELVRRIRAGTLDTIGRAVYPVALPDSFLIAPVGSSITIGVGRMYVDGFLVENHGAPAPSSGGWIPPNPGAPGPQPAWDPTLDELVGQNAIDYTQQPYFPNAATVAPFPTAGGPYLIYLDVWQREVTFLERPDLIEKAVAVDSTGRMQIAWQVRWLDVSDVTLPGAVVCSTPDEDIGPWETLIQPSAGRLTTGVVQSAASGPCCLTPNTGFTGQENQLYRVEIHQGGTATSNPVGTFKWSRDNASVATAVTGIAQAGSVLTVQSTGKDSVLRFSPNDWVEVTDDWLELNGLPGELHQVSLVSDTANTMTLSSPVSAVSFPVNADGLTDPSRYTRVIRWDQGGKIFQGDGTTVWVDLNAAGSTGDIKIPPPGTSLILENGVTVSFDLNPSTGSFHSGDYWAFAARATDGTVESLVEAPPLGIHHHYARLAVFTPPGPPSDCRLPWPPSADCECTACVTAASHNGGTKTIQQAVDLVTAAGGGKVCLGPGTYNILETIRLGGAQLTAQNIKISGHGLPTLVPSGAKFSGSLMFIDNAIDITVEEIAFAAGPANPNLPGGGPVAIGLSVQQSAYVRVERCGFGLATDGQQLSPAIEIGGVPVLNCTIRENLFTNVVVGIQLSGADFSFLANLAVEDNQMFCSTGAVFLSNPKTLSFAEIRFAKNFVQSSSGFVLVGAGIDATIEDNTFTISATTASQTGPYPGAIICNGVQTRVVNNNIFGNSSPLTATVTGANGALGIGTYIWVVTAMNAAGQETLATSAATLNLTGAGQQVTLQWNVVAGAASYNLYRTAANGAALFFDSPVPQGAGPTISFVDSLGDQSLGSALPVAACDGIVLGSPSSDTTMYGSQIVGNRISGLGGRGILVLGSTVILETIIAQNQITSLGRNGILMSGTAADLNIVGNAISNVQLFPTGEKIVTGIEVRAGINVNLSENSLTGIGPANPGNESRFVIYVRFGTRVRIEGNRIADVGPSLAVSGGILVIAIGRLDVDDNEVRRASLPPAKLDTTPWTAIEAIGLNEVSVRGNLFESFGSVVTVEVGSETSGVVFSDNHCLLDNPSPGGPVLVAEIVGAAIVAANNFVKGPTEVLIGGVPPPSMALVTFVKSDNPPVTVIGNITAMGITVNDGPIPAAMRPLNL
jgi:hypothetical protein